ncbi:TPA: metallophosphoesterase [Vibrio parahaemolyticus]|nr:metallophosphoesterase [Vibrio parahaemolyticus]HCM0821122.1 metallophosphoesterase [Vibrio parahaemolyticus]
MNKTNKLDNINMYKLFNRNYLGNDYFVGDIHGEYDLLTSLLSHINFDIKKDRLFSVGDICDRGPKSIECIELAKSNWFFPVIGNHESFILDFNNENIYAKKIWIMNGGSWWFDLGEDKQQELKNIINENFTLSLEVKTNFGNVGLVHSYYPHSKWPITKIETSKIDTKRILWDRNLDQTKIPKLDLLITGHTPQNIPTYNGFNLNIDTGSGHQPSDNIYKPSLTICTLRDSEFNFFSAYSGEVSEYTLHAYN